MAETAEVDRRSVRAQRLQDAQRAAVLAAAALQFERKGFEQTTMADIARQAGLAVGSLYKLFPSKQALYRTLLERHAAALLAHPAGSRPVEIHPGSAGGSLSAHAAHRLPETDDLWPPEPLAGLPDGGAERREHSVEARRAEIRAEILAAALRVFEAQGYYGAAMAGIAAEAGVATGTLYNFFPSKEALFHTLIEQKTGAFFAYLRAEVDPLTGASAKLARLVAAECAFYAANRPFLRIFITARSGFEWAAKQELGAAFRQQYAGHLAGVAGILADGLAHGELRPMDPDEMAQALVGMLNATLFEWTIAHDTAPLAERAARITHLFLHGANIA
jgi:AcrR family transcriptional regulator